jgi:hypothetical protein
MCSLDARSRKHPDDPVHFFEVIKKKLVQIEELRWAR